MKKNTFTCTVVKTHSGLPCVVEKALIHSVIFKKGEKTHQEIEREMERRMKGVLKLAQEGEKSLLFFVPLPS